MKTYFHECRKWDTVASPSKTCKLLPFFYCVTVCLQFAHHHNPFSRPALVLKLFHRQPPFPLGTKT
jgi:hypothetical protein